MDKDRIKDILMSDDIIKSINDNWDVLLTIIPEINDMINFSHNHPHHHLDVWNHTLLSLSISPKDFETRLVLLLHDLGKPHCYQDGEVRHFRGHPKVSKEMSLNILNRLGFTYGEIEEICYLIEQHDIPIKDSEIIDNKELMKKRFTIQSCDALAHNPFQLEKRLAYLKMINKKINCIEKQQECNELIDDGIQKNKTYTLTIKSYNNLSPLLS